MRHHKSGFLALDEVSAMRRRRNMVTVDVFFDDVKQTLQRELPNWKLTGRSDAIEAEFPFGLVGVSLLVRPECLFVHSDTLKPVFEDGLGAPQGDVKVSVNAPAGIMSLASSLALQRVLTEANHFLALVAAQYEGRQIIKYMNGG